MNGRMYDFNNGRFLSVDPYIQGDDSNAINPYSYIQNNPLSGIDPSGYAIVAAGFDCDIYNCSALLSGASASEAERDNGAEQSEGSKSVLFAGDVSDLNAEAIRKNCQDSNCDNIVAAIDQGGLATLIDNGDGTVDFDYYRPERIQDLVLLIGEQALKDLAPGGGAIDCSTRECSAFEKTMAVMDLTAPGAEKILSGLIVAAKMIKNGDEVGEAAISMDEALERAADYMVDGVPVQVVESDSGIQFLQEFYEGGDRVNLRAGIDINPNSGHVRKRGEHLNLQTRRNGKLQRGDLEDPHTPIDPDTIREGDY